MPEFYKWSLDEIVASRRNNRHGYKQNQCASARHKGRLLQVDTVVETVPIHARGLKESARASLEGRIAMRAPMHDFSRGDVTPLTCIKSKMIKMVSGRTAHKDDHPCTFNRIASSERSSAKRQPTNSPSARRNVGPVGKTTRVSSPKYQPEGRAAASPKNRNPDRAAFPSEEEDTGPCQVELLFDRERPKVTALTNVPEEIPIEKHAREHFLAVCLVNYQYSRKEHPSGRHQAKEVTDIELFQALRGASKSLDVIRKPPRTKKSVTPW